MTAKPKLELTWIGKESRPRLEPRILIEDEKYSRHSAVRRESDVFDNVLIHGDNLLALKALESDYTAKIKCIYIDPPFNTGVAFEHYDDGVEHSIWLGLMAERFRTMHNLLTPDGVLAVHLDDNEVAYCKVLLDEIFGRSNYLNMITTTTNAPSGFKATGTKIFSTANYILLYARQRSETSLKKVFIKKGYDTSYSKYLENPESPFSEWRWCGIADAFARKRGFPTAKEAKKALSETFHEEIAQFAIDHAERVFRTAAIGGGAAAKRKATIEKSKLHRKVVLKHEGDAEDAFFIVNGEMIVFYAGRLTTVDGLRVPAEIVTDVWTDISWTGIAKEGGVEFKNGKKPEALLKRVIEMTTDAGDIVLDSFAGSGTTGAVAHKLKRKWIMVELGNHCETHVVPRLGRVIDGTDLTGVTKLAHWVGGGGYRYYRLAPSLLEKDQFDNWIISKSYNAEMLSEAMCKHFGFTYAPSAEHYWMHGDSSETDFIYVTTASFTHDQLRAISQEVGDERTLLVCCKAFQTPTPEGFPNLTLRKIPATVLNRCEWGKDDYSLKIENLPMMSENGEEAGERNEEYLQGEGDDDRGMPYQGGLFGESTK